MIFDFKNKEKYLADRKKWAAEYIELSSQIRKTRVAFIEAQRVVSKSSFNPENHTPEERKAHFNKKWNAADVLQARIQLRIDANKMLLDLQAAKEEACRQWTASRQIVTSE